MTTESYTFEIELEEYKKILKKVTILRMTLMHPWYHIHEEMNIPSDFYDELIKAIRKIQIDNPELFY